MDLSHVICRVQEREPLLCQLPEYGLFEQVGERTVKRWDPNFLYSDEIGNQICNGECRIPRGKEQVTERCI